MREIKTMADDASAIARDARERAYSTPLDDFHVADVDHFTSDTHWPWFERLRREDPSTTALRANTAPIGR
jgi:hypothetical protein